jgi:hypothetical protein
MTVTAGDGTRFTLVVPQGALLSEIEITMTPVSHVGEFPFSGGLVAAVQLEPEGLLLWEPASLTIEPAVPIDVTEQLSFTWHGQGKRFHLYPLQVDPSSITMKLVHFSGYGVGRGTDVEADELPPLPLPEDELFPLPQDKLESDTEKQTRKERKERNKKKLTKKKLKKRKRQMCVDFSRAHLNAFKILKDQFDKAVASRDEGWLRCLLNQALKWERFSRIEEAFAECQPAELTAAYAILTEFRLSAFGILADKAYERCGSNVAEALMLIRLEKEARQYQSWYSDGVTEIRFKILADQIKEKAKKCAQFELQFESVINSEQYVSHVRAKVMIKYEPGKTPLAEAPLEYVSFTSKDPCLIVLSYKGSTFTVKDMEFDLNTREGGECSGAPESEATLISMAILPFTDPPDLAEVKTCEPPLITFPLQHWGGLFAAVFHAKELEPNRGAIVIRGWDKGQNQLLARRTYLQTDSLGDETVSEITTLDLFHRPE